MVARWNIDVDSGWQSMETVERVYLKKPDVAAHTNGMPKPLADALSELRCDSALQLHWFTTYVCE